LLLSLAFYGGSGFADLGLLLIVIAISFNAGLLLERRSNRLLCAVAVLAVVSPLLLVKFLPLFPAFSWGGALASRPGAIPPGLSFFTLQAVGYLIDVNTRRVQANRSALLHALFLSYFPQLVAGPIGRATHLIPQLQAPRRPGVIDYYRAGKLAIWGYALKLLVADQLGLAIDTIRLGDASGTPAASILVISLFTLQIYFDFYAYSCLAIAFGESHGVTLTQNFNFPYAAANPVDFWRRWHISLSTWWRDYVYIPLGGSRKGIRIWLIATLAVFLLSGLWHGTGVSFLVWGAAHGVLVIVYVVSKRLALKYFSRRLQRMLRLPMRAGTIMAISLLWLPFLQPDLSRVMRELVNIGSGISTPILTTKALWLLMTLAISPVLVLSVAVLFFDKSFMRIIRAEPPTTRSALVSELALLDASIILLVLLGDMGGRAFIYFRF